jgi:23S rRNA (uracil1939-C5)-methyltransferase
LAPLKTWLTELRAAEAVTHLELIHTEQKTAVVLRHVQPLTDVDLQNLATISVELNFTAWLQGSEAHQLQDLTGQDVDPRMSYRLPDYELELDFHPQDFIQVNPEVNTQMVVQALQLLALKGNERVLDLFCGIGNFTLPLARKCAEAIGIEAVDSMVQRGRENAAKLGIKNAQFTAANLLTMTEHRLNQTCGKIDAVLLDPPRDGAKEIIAKLPKLSPKRIVYVSCNPATLARDAKALIAAGYQLDSVGVLDMFPHTAHVESMALFIKR